jgi:hypothetical protein
MTDDNDPEPRMPGPYYFLIVGAIFGVVIVSAMDAENLWHFFRDLIFMSGAIGTAIGVFVAIKIARDQIASAKNIEDQRKRDEEHLAALKLKAALTPQITRMTILAEQITEALSDKDVVWHIDKDQVRIDKDEDQKVGGAIGGFVKLIGAIQTVDQVTMLGRKDPKVLEQSINLENNLAQALWWAKHDKTTGTSAGVMLHSLLALRNFCELFCWLDENFDVSSNEGASAIDTRISNSGWPMIEDIQTLLEKNPPVSWGEYKDYARRLMGRPSK